MSERPEPDLDRVREALREHDQRDADERPADEPPREEPPRDEPPPEDDEEAS